MMMKLAVLLAGLAVADAANATSTTAAVVGKYYSPWVVKVQEALAKVGAMQYPEGYPSGEAYSLRTQCGWCMETVSGSDSGHASIINVGRLVAVESMKALAKPAAGTSQDIIKYNQATKLSKCFQFTYDMCWRDDGGIFRFLTPCPASLICAQCLGLPTYACGSFN